MLGLTRVYRKRALAVTMRLFFLAFLCASASLAGAATADQRGLFLQALAAAQRGDLALSKTSLAKLQDYPLYDYLTAADLRYRLASDADATVDAHIQRFVDAHPDLPPARRLRRRWLASLAQRKRWQLVLDNTEDSHATTAECRLVHAKIALGGAPRQAALALWRVGHSQPEACDFVFAWLDQRGLLGDGEILRRARLAVLADHYGLARYLGAKLDGARKARVHGWLAAVQTPTNLRFTQKLDGDIAVHAFKRLALRDLDGAADLLATLQRRLSLTAQQRYAMGRYIALLYAQAHRPEALVWFARLDHARMDEHALGWEIRSAVYHRRWALAQYAIEALPAKLADKPEWRYWRARALAETGHGDAAKRIYASLSRERAYYGYLAADAINRDYRLNEQPLAANAAALARVRGQPALARAHELHALDMPYKANREWNVVIAGLNAAALGQAARIAYRWRWYSRAIITLAKADYWDDLDIRYPLVYRKPVHQAAASNDLDPAYILGIIRTESLFQPAVRSSAGAIGLMQLLPGTARLVARHMDASRPSTAALTTPAVNIRLGSRYLANMLARWHGNIALATASYNAGPNRIARWLPERELDPTIWIANIPYTQTRRYVERAMAHMTVFQDRLGEDIVALDKRFAPVLPAYPERQASN